jgi:hypothetical protein
MVKAMICSWILSNLFTYDGKNNTWARLSSLLYSSEKLRSGQLLPQCFFTPAKSNLCANLSALILVASLFQILRTYLIARAANITIILGRLQPGYAVYPLTAVNQSLLSTQQNIVTVRNGLSG